MIIELGKLVKVIDTLDEGAYLACKSIFHKALNLFKFDCEITLESSPGTNQYLAMKVPFLAQGNTGAFPWDSNQRLTVHVCVRLCVRACMCALHAFVNLFSVPNVDLIFFFSFSSSCLFYNL